MFITNTDYNTVVENKLPTPVVALCIRLLPTAWHVFPCMRIEVLGCIRNYTTDVIYHQEPLVTAQGTYDARATLSLADICHT